jgi:hypothetical protein
MRKAKVGIILTLLVVASLGIGYLAENPTRQTAPSTSTSSQQTMVSAFTRESSTTTSFSTHVSTISSSGLEFSVDLSATAIEPGRPLVANVTLFNTLNESLSLPFAGVPANLTAQIAAWNNHDFACGIGGLASYVAGFALFKGHVSADNVSLAPDPLQLAEEVQVPCGSLIIAQNDSIVFMPDSENASIPKADPFGDSINLNVTTGDSSGLYGYWNRTSYICCVANANAPNLFRYLTPGEYTIAAEDIWGDRVFAYFQVIQSPNPSLAVSAQESPFSSEGHPIIGITLANFADVPITSLNATLRPVTSPSNSTSYQFIFSVNSSAPLLPGQYVQDVRTLQGDLFDIGVNYPLTISGVLASGETFTYTQEIQFVNSAPSS